MSSKASTSVPTSNVPPIREWADHFWYTIRTAALQARTDISAEDAQLLVDAFHALCVTLPCPECRGHYKADWALFPFTLAHARDCVAAMHWVEELRIRIEARKKPSATSARVPAPAAPVVAAKRPPTPAQRQIQIKKSLMETRANRAGPRGCNCGGKKNALGL